MYDQSKASHHTCSSQIERLIESKKRMKRFSRKSEERAAKSIPATSLSEGRKPSPAASATLAVDETTVSSSTATPSKHGQLDTSRDEEDLLAVGCGAGIVSSNSDREPATSGGIAVKKFQRTSAPPPEYHFARHPTSTSTADLIRLVADPPPLVEQPKETLTSRRRESFNHTKCFVKQLSENRSFESKTRSLTPSQLKRLQEEVGTAFEAQRRALSSSNGGHLRTGSPAAAPAGGNSMSVPASARVSRSRTNSPNIATTSSGNSNQPSSLASRAAPPHYTEAERRRPSPATATSSRRSGSPNPNVAISAAAAPLHQSALLARVTSKPKHASDQQGAPLSREGSSATTSVAIVAGSVPGVTLVIATSAGSGILQQRGAARTDSATSTNFGELPRRSRSMDPPAMGFADPTIGANIGKLRRGDSASGCGGAASLAPHPAWSKQRSKSPVGIPPKAALLPTQQKARPTFRTRSPPLSAVVVEATAEALIISPASTPDRPKQPSRNADGTGRGVSNPKGGAAGESWSGPRGVEIFSPAHVSGGQLTSSYQTANDSQDHHPRRDDDEWSVAEHRRSLRAQEAAAASSPSSSQRRSGDDDAPPVQPPGYKQSTSNGAGPATSFTPPAHIATFCARVKKNSAAPAAGSGGDSSQGGDASTKSRRIIVQCVPELSTDLTSILQPKILLKP